ncbi:MAG TPA: carboxypeptidase-like regulatory domain-containing protein, partial [Verrucomicrobiae bacterium]|nr:carboxypeptidase-like regulatory domain-containing protein [Verrucomicrobiae bacterium]
QPVSGVRITEVAPPPAPQEQMVLFQPITNNSDSSWSYTYVPRYLTNQIPFILTKDGYATTFIVVPVSQVDLNSLVFVINKGFTITGRVTDWQQRPIAKARVENLAPDVFTHPIPPNSVTTDENGSFTFSNVWGNNTDDLRQQCTIVTNESGILLGVSYYSQIAALKTNENGEVSLHESTGDYQPSVPLEVQADGFAPQTDLLELTDTTNVVNFTLSPGNILRGSVLDDAGDPVTNAAVETRWGGDSIPPTVFGVEWQTRTDATGQFEWDSAPAGPILFDVSADGYQWEDVSLVADGNDHEITLKRIATP